jgi:hypothetical protein
MAIYEKSLIGQREIQGSQRLLNLRQRQVLILVDGKRNVEELQEALNNPQVIAILDELEQSGFIVRIDGSPAVIRTLPALAPAADEGPSEPPLEEDQIQAIKAILLDSTEEYLGIMGKALRQQIESSQDGNSLRACISEWHMALRESKAGRNHAHQRMEEVQALLAQPAAVAESIKLSYINC